MVTKTEKPNVEENENDIDITSFFSDPKHAKEAGFMRNAIKHVFGELASEEEAERKKVEEETAKNKKPEGFLDFIFGVKK